MSVQKRLSIFVGTGRKYLRTYFILLFCFIAMFHQNYVNWSLTLWNVCDARFVWGIFFVWVLYLLYSIFRITSAQHDLSAHKLTCACIVDFVYNLSAWQTQQFNDLNATPPPLRREICFVIIELLVVIKFHTFAAVICSHNVIKP